MNPLPRQLSRITCCIALGVLAACGAESASSPAPVDASGSDTSWTPGDTTGGDTASAWDTGNSADTATPGDAATDTTAPWADVYGDTTGPIEPCPPVGGDILFGDPLVITTREGPVVGVLEGGVRTWLGVPYAAPPLGPLRFAPPAPAVCRTSPFVASQFRALCPQRDDAARTLGDEDCLTLNIWSPAAPSEPLPVLVFIHGGGHIQGGASVALTGGRPLYDGQYLAAAGPAVVVTLQYRLGAIGWLAHRAFQTAPDVPPANRGLLDQQAALRWIARHAEAFGGDPARIVIFGESAGAVDVGVHLALPSSKGLFAGAIVQSGAPRATSGELAFTIGEALVSAAGCEGDDTVSCLSALPLDALLDAMPGSIRIGDPGLGTALGEFGPVIDGVLIGDDPLALLARQQGPRPPVIAGSNTEELAGLLSISVDSYDALLSAVTRSFGEPLARLGRSSAPEVTARLLEAYGADATNADPAATLVAMYTDLRFGCPTLALASLLSDAGRSTWRYLFARRAETRNGPIPASHGIELAYVFGSWRNIPLYEPAEADRSLSAAMMAAWTSFAATGRPAIPGSGASVPGWASFSSEGTETLLLDAPIGIDAAPDAARCKVWAELLGQSD